MSSMLSKYQSLALTTTTAQLVKAAAALCQLEVDGKPCKRAVARTLTNVPGRDAFRLAATKAFMAANGDANPCVTCICRVLDILDAQAAAACEAAGVPVKPFQFPTSAKAKQAVAAPETIEAPENLTEAAL